jgi:hypothetical protein
MPVLTNASLDSNTQNFKHHTTLCTVGKCKMINQDLTFCKLWHCSFFNLREVKIMLELIIMLTTLSAAMMCGVFLSQSKSVRTTLGVLYSSNLKFFYLRDVKIMLNLMIKLLT